MLLEVNKMKNIENCSKTKGIMHLVFGIPDTFKSEGYEWQKKIRISKKLLHIILSEYNKKAA